MIELSEAVRSGWCVVSVRGRADALSAPDLESRLSAAVENNAQVAADLSGVEYISSCGIRALLGAARAAQMRSARFTVCSPSAAVKKVFEISRLDQVLEVQEAAPC